MALVIQDSKVVSLNPPSLKLSDKKRGGAEQANGCLPAFIVVKNFMKDTSALVHDLIVPAMFKNALN